MRIYLMRHASAEPRKEDGPDCSGGHLTDKGKAQCDMVALLFRRMGTRFDRIVSSSLARANETALRVIADMGIDLDLEIDDGLRPESPLPAALKAVVGKEVRCVLAVSHQPLLSQITATLVGYGSADIEVRKGGVVELDLISRKPLRAELLGLVRPLHLREPLET